MTDLTDLTLAEARDALARGDASSVEMTRAFVEAIEAARGLNAYVLETPEQALAMAQASDERRARGEAGPLEGLALGVKELDCEWDLEDADVAAVTVAHRYQIAYRTRFDDLTQQG